MMREDYIKLIKEYLKVRPEYAQNTEELKRHVMAVGATEEEFNLALSGATLPPKKEEKHIGFKKLPNIKLNKRWIVATAVIVLLIAIPSFIKISIGKDQINISPAQETTGTPSITLKTNAVPIVYANLKPIDISKTFSVPSNNIKLTITGSPKKEVLGFFPYWMIPEQDKINLQTVTSISLFGLETDSQGNIVTKADNDQMDPGWAMWKNPELDKLIKRAKLQNVKVYLTLKSFNNDNIEKLSLSDTSQKAFISNAIYLLNSKNLDGINIDFEYVGEPSEGVRSGFTRLITNLNAEMRRQFPNTSLTVDTYLVSGSEKDLFDIPVLAPNIDAFVIMGYDMHTPLGNPGPVSAMGGDTNIIGYVQNYLEQVPPSKLILAVPYYGYDWLETSDASPSAATTQILPYAVLEDNSKNIQLSWNDTSQTPFYTYRDTDGQQHVVHFDNVRSLGIKYDFINKKALKGVGIWALGYDGMDTELQKLLVDKFFN